MRTRSPEPPTGRSSRRGFLRGLLGLAGVGLVGSGAAGCDLFGSDDAPPDRSDEVTAFLGATVALAERYTATIAAVPTLEATLTPIRDAHRTHAQTLAQAIGVDVPSASPAQPPPTDPAQAIAALSTAEKSARDEAVRTCVGASARLAPMIGSIAAARASHVEVLK